MKRLNILDASWLALETDETPMHVATLQIFSLPEDAPDTFLSDLTADFKRSDEVVRPWCNKLRYSNRLGRIISPAWIKDKDIDLDYHVRHSALPSPGGEKELGVLVSRIHSISLDFNRPLWECYIIEGLEPRRFAIYTKIHHSLMDGVSGVRLLQRTLSESPDTVDMAPPWLVQSKRKSKRAGSDNVPSLQGMMKQAVNAVKKQASNTPTLATAMGKLIYSGTQKSSALIAPFVGPQSVLNKRVTPQRRIATQEFSLDEMKKLSKAAECSLNDIVLYLCGTALRKFLLESDSLPKQSLTAGIPVNVRPAGDTSTGTAISFMIASLGTNVAEPLKRLETIKNSTKQAKEHLQSLPKDVLNQYTVLLMSPYISQLLTGIAGHMRPVFNFTISNVPGPKEPLYFNGARQEAMFPLSLIAHGGALNITCLSYLDQLNFGFVGCRDTLPHMQHLAVYSGEALAELSDLVVKPKPRAKRKKSVK